MDIDLLLEIEKKYDPITHTIMDLDGEFLLRVDVESIRKEFDLHSLLEVNNKIDFKLFEDAFNQFGVDMQ